MIALISRSEPRLSHEEADNLAQRVLGDMDPYPGESPDEYYARMDRAEAAFAARHPNWKGAKQ